jgi:23S rRNA (cytosine1962-C5)-methyltransferase
MRIVPTVLECAGWDDHELLDSGGGAKLERYGPHLLARPETQAIWKPRLPSSTWANADATFERGADEGGAWRMRTPVPERWEMGWQGLRFHAGLTAFRHTGVFPEQSEHWVWMESLLAGARRPTRLLDLFGYTGLASLVAARAGAAVTYVDASRPAMAWARRNQEVAGLQSKPIRWLLDDAAKFVAREQRRDARYDAIVMDPPVFGRGPKGEIWRFGEHFPRLFDAAAALLSDQPLLVLVNAYATDLSPITLANVVADALESRGGTLEYGELVLAPKRGGPRISTGIYARWTAEAKA